MTAELRIPAFKGGGRFAPVVFAIVVAGTASAQDVDRKPIPMRSVAETSGVEGSLFKRFKDILSVTAKGDDGAFKAALADGAALDLMSRVDGQWQKQPFTAEVVRAASKSCLGPFSVDEGKKWIQFSWVCNPKGETEISKFVTFRESPEIAVTVFFVGDKIQSIDAVEPIPFPGGQRLWMNSYELMKAKQ